MEEDSNMTKVKKVCKNCGHSLEEHHINNPEDVITGEEAEIECNAENCNCDNYE